MTHWRPYPRLPRTTAHAERFNRTIQEQLVDYHEDQLFHDLPGFNRKLAAWLLDCNTVLPHHSLSACNLPQLPHP
ncbi:integrase core domain-containing protein [Candidatus Spongiihabitans sp.]|uniref:integrase core domain-containing protein n=1 Tax=Candidatus Spongiihabitans sp. TaxID=3101308 RepID=UPI003C6FAC94